MTINNEIVALKATAELIIDEQAVNDALDAMAEKINDDYQDKDPIILCVMNGGLFFTSELTKRLNFPFMLDYLHATRYNNDVRGSDVIWKAAPQLNLTGRHVLILDDILDEGHTLKAIQHALKKQQVASIKIAVLTIKDHDRREEGVDAQYKGLTVPDRYVFGCGMDIKGYYRNVMAIYALAQ